MEEKKSSHPHKKKYGTFFGWIIHNLFMILIISLLAWFILMIWFGMKIILQDVYATSDQINSFVKIYTQFIFLHNPLLLSKALFFLAKIQNTIQQTIEWLFIWIDRLFQSLQPSSLIHYQQTISAIPAILFGVIEIVALRLFIFILNIPFLLCLIFLAIVDGLGQRDIRKHQGSRESTFFFHRIKPLNAKLFYLIFLIYMSAPTMIYPPVILIPMTIILSIGTMTSVKSYKKYA